MEVKNKNRSRAAIITAIICFTLILVSAIGGWVYIQSQKLSQERTLKEQELQIQKDASKEQADAIRDAATSECIGNSEELWQRMGC
jgi:predicted negative regulator of RcsB-dependent stress response